MSQERNVSDARMSRRRDIVRPKDRAAGAILTMNPLELRSVWISDVHLGLRACKAEFLLDFLHSVRSEYLYPVGDIIDFWTLRSGWYWPQMHSDVLQAVLHQAQNGTQVVYLPGNHDELFREYAGKIFGGVHVRSDAVHETADGRKFLIAYLKHKVKNAVNYISNFDHALVHEARKRRLDGVICGHIHKAAIQRINGLGRTALADLLGVEAARSESHRL
jgi:UDP-2,3-diacylglucosamine pyrophosphatase LpxH